MADYYHPVNFHFQVTFEGLKETALDIRFQSVSGLSVELETEAIKEGGVNRYEHILPVRRKYSDLVLKRGILKPKDSAVTKWCKNAFDKFEVLPITIMVSLLTLPCIRLERILSYLM